MLCVLLEEKCVKVKVSERVTHICITDGDEESILTSDS
jgi:hypothetical protein